MRMTTNPNCDNDKCIKTDGEVRVLPTGGNSNAILCFDCYCWELVFRHQRNLELDADSQTPSPKWRDLKVYDAA